MLLIVLIPARSISQDLYSKTYTIRDGLPSSYIFSTYEDKLGYLWVGTTNGLSRFDGKSFFNFGYNEELPDLRVDAMLMDQQQRFWVGTRRGMAELKVNKFTTYPVSDTLQITFVFHIMETTDGNILALTNVGVYEFKTDHWQKKKLYPGYENKPCKAIIETADGLFINYGNIIVEKKTDGSYSIIAAFHEPASYYNSLSRFGNDIYVSTATGLCSIKNGQLVKLPGPLGRLQGVYSFCVDSKKNYWVGNENNGLQYVPSHDSLNIITFYKRQGVNLISAINEDSKANLWVADFSGLIRITEKGYKIYDILEPGGNGVIRNIIPTQSGNLLINDGTGTFKIFKNAVLASQQLKMIGFPFLSQQELIIDNYAVDDKSRYWYAVRGFGLAMQTGNIVYNQKKQVAHLGDEVFDVLFDQYRKRIVLAVRTQHLPCQYADEKGYQPFPIANNIAVNGNIMQLHQCINGNILFTTDQGVLYAINTRDECREQLHEFKSKGVFQKIYNDPNGDLWIIYNGRGVRRYTWQNDQLIFKEKIDKTNGLSDDNVAEMCFDNLGNIWLLTNSGVTVLAKVPGSENNDQYKTIAFFNSLDLQLEDAYSCKLIKSTDGKLWLSKKKQLICFYPEKINYFSEAPGIQIENIKLNLRQTEWSAYADSLTGVFGSPVNLKLAHDNNALGFFYKAVFATGTEDVRYSYMLLGLDTSWSQPTGNDYVSYVNLQPGNYIFKVRARFPNTGWSKPAAFSFRINKAFWETWWFRVLMILLFSSLIVAVFQYRIQQFNTRARLKEQLQELESKALKAQMNPHFIFNAMNSIQSLILNNRTDEASGYISKFARLMRQVLENADSVLVSIEKELYSIRLYIALEKLRMNIELDYREEIDPAIMALQEKIPAMIIQPFIENALWHGLNKKSGHRSLLVKISATVDWLIVEITDNGIGRAKAAVNYDQLPEGHLSKATDITSQRLINFNRTTAVQPIAIFDLVDDAGQATGTIVRLHIRRSIHLTG